MAFKTAGGDEFKPSRTEGLPMMWQNLEDDCCPKCADPVFLFEDISLWKCKCGFKISDARKKELVEIKEEQKNGWNRFGFGNYDDEPPFGR